MDRCAAEMFHFSQITTVRDYLNQSIKRKKCRFRVSACGNLCKIAVFGEKN